jgi:pyruvate ferredoxin oxidoreductase delta subunit
LTKKNYMTLCKPEVLPVWRDMPKACIIVEPGNASAYRSGDWKSQRPVWDFEKCIKCGTCNIICPDLCVDYNDNGYLEADLNYCKGCGLCAKECPRQAIKMVEEEE